MDEKVLRLFADVGPNAQGALDSYVSLQWAEFIAGYVVIFSLVIAFLLALYLLNRPSQKGTDTEDTDTADGMKIRELEKELEGLKNS